MLCYAMLRYATLRYAMRCDAMRCDAMRCDAVLREPEQHFAQRQQTNVDACNDIVYDTATCNDIV